MPDVARAYSMAIRTEQEWNAKSFYGPGLSKIGAAMPRVSNSKSVEDW